jgi:hypothetical protein
MSIHSTNKYNFNQVSQATLRHQNASIHLNRQTNQNISEINELITRVIKNSEMHDQKKAKNLHIQLKHNTKSLSFIQGLQLLDNNQLALTPNILADLFKLNGDFEWKKKLFENVSINIIDTHVMVGYIKSASKEHWFQEVERAYNFALNNEMLHPYLISAYIQAAGENQFLKEANEAFATAFVLDMINSFIICDYITAVAKSGGVKGAIVALNLAEEKGLTDTNIICAAITAAGNDDCFDLSAKIFEMWCNKEQREITPDILSAYIKAAGKHGSLEDARLAFNIGLGQGNLNSFAINAYIIAAAANDDFTGAEVAFNIGKERGLLNSVSYASYIRVLGNAGYTNHAIKIFESFKETDLFALNSTKVFEVHGAIIEILFANDQVKDVKKYFQEIKHLLPNTQQNEYSLDLHSVFSIGLCLCISLEFLSSRKDRKEPVILICGKGNHSKKEKLENGRSRLKEYLLDNIPKYLPNVQGKVMPNNPGRLSYCFCDS